MYSYPESDASYKRGQFAKNRELAEEDVRVQRGKAVRTVAGHARDAEDLSALLAMLGLETTEGTSRRPTGPQACSARQAAPQHAWKQAHHEEDRAEYAWHPDDAAASPQQCRDRPVSDLIRRAGERRR